MAIYFRHCLKLTTFWIHVHNYSDQNNGSETLEIPVNALSSPMTPC
jgi:hypothetical protein